MVGIIYDYFFKIVILLEDLCCRYIGFGKLYHRLFYQGMIEREVELAGLKPGERVLHIGGGCFPFTAIYLALKGYKVQVIDMEAKAVEKAKAVIEKWGLKDYIEVLEANGLDVSGEGFDVVWISLHVHPKEEIIKKLLSTLPSSGRIIYRNPRGVLRRFYPVVKPEQILKKGDYHLADQIIQKESIVIYNQGGVVA